MTLLGKILVCVNFVMSLFMAAWALGLYTQRVDWSNTQAKSGKPEGVLATRQRQVKEAWEKLLPAEARHRSAEASLRTLEQRRPGDRTFYADELKHLARGADERSPARTISWKAGRMEMEKQGPDRAERPKMVVYRDKAGRQLRSLDSYRKEFDATLVSILQAMDDYEKAVKRDTELTQEIAGIQGRTKGLRQRLCDEDDKTRRVLDEQAALEPIMINANVESQLLLKRQKSLLERLQELGWSPGKVAARE